MDNTEKKYDSTIEQIKQIRKIYFWRTAFFGLIILVAGISIGAATMSILSAHNMTTRPAGMEYASLMTRLNQILGLTQAQTNKIRPIINENMQHLQEIRDDARDEIIKTLELMNKEISPILGERQKVVWSNELLRLQGEVSPEQPRGGGGGGGRGMRRGAEQPGQGGLGRRGPRGQQRMGMGMGRGRAFESPVPSGPNAFNNNINESKTIINDSNSNATK